MTPLALLASCTTLCIGCQQGHMVMLHSCYQCLIPHPAMQILILERSKTEAESRLQEGTQSLEQNNHTVQVTQCYMQGNHVYRCLLVSCPAPHCAITEKMQ